ncbi:UPF0052-domain-containing protein [Aulographum hederae CBS 113979]|uniref:UPF0052-domain-containing protein n=1 Tax=Aulographum hederae CBS 113979 TaxID=1176131 RepID=A0A6G1H0K6_9PEZI|nr:UPF0052-domain-containing protein [Aulographum hederae CBS 113979]
MASAQVPALNIPPNGLTRNGMVVLSGGSAANNLVDIFKTLIEGKKLNLSYVIPISDNGGSSSELIRVFGGPGIGDVRSRLVRLIPDDDDINSQTAAIRAFISHRLPDDPLAAKLEWLDIVEARHETWHHIPSSKKELIRSFLNLMNLEIVKRARPSSVFNFSSASIGNMFLTGARLFSGSFESAIYLLSTICSVPSTISVLPAINTNFSHHISVGLKDGTVITGQNAISHPSVPTALSQTPWSPISEIEAHDSIEDANLPGSLPSLRKQNIAFSKSDEEELPARIDRLWYINPYGQEIRVAANPKVLDAVDASRCIIYSIGSLYTSIIPSIVLRGVGEAIANQNIRYKILILNSTIDRETGPCSDPYSATDFIAAISKAAHESRGLSSPPTLDDYKTYVTHLIHLEGDGTPKVDKAELAGLGIQTLRVYGRKTELGKPARYDEKGLLQALEATIGNAEVRGDRSRRNTLEM